MSYSVPGRKPEPLAGLDRRPGQDDPVDLLGLQRLHGLGHRQVGLAGAGRADAEDDRVLVDRVDVALLVQRLRPDGAAAAGQDVERQHLGRALVGALLEHADDAADGVRGQRLALGDQLQQLGEDALGQRVVGRRAGQGDLVAADVDVAARASFSMSRSISSPAPSRLTISCGSATVILF